MTPELKEKMRIGREKAKEARMAEKDTSKFVSIDDFNNFKTSVVGILENISNKLNVPNEEERRVMKATVPEKVTVEKEISPSNEDVTHNLDAVSQEFQTIFEKYFDMEDGFKGMLKGVSFKIEVPLKLSNAQEAHLKFYKKDVRHKILDGHDLENSLESYCKLVAQNLHYKRNVRLKI